MLMTVSGNHRGDGSVEHVSAAMRKVLQEGIDIHRTVAARALARIEGDGSVGTLIEALLDEDEDVRSDASEALARIGNGDAAKPLLENLIGDPAIQVKLNAIDGLGAMNFQQVAPLLRRLLKGRDEEIVWDEEEYYQTEWDDWTDVQLHALKALGGLGAEEAVEDIVEMLNHADSHDVSETGFKVLDQLGVKGIAALGVYIDDGDARCRRRAAAIVGASLNAHATAALNKALSHKDPDVRYAVGGALMERAPADARMKLLLADINPVIRADMAKGCLQHHREVAPVLIRDPDARVRGAVYDCLVKFPDLVAVDQAKAALAADLDGTDEAAASAALRASQAIAPETVRKSIMERLADGKSPAEMRLTAIKLLEGDDSAEAVEALIGIIGDETRSLRLQGMAALAGCAARMDWPNAAGEALLSALRGELIPAPDDEDALQADEADAPEDDVADDTADETKASDAAGPEDGAEQDGAGSDEDAGADEEADDEIVSAPPNSTLAAILSDDPIIAEVLRKKSASVGLSPKDMEFLQLAQDQIKEPRRRNVSVEPMMAPHQDVRRFAARLLGDVGQPEAIEALADALGDADQHVVRNAAESLCCAGKDMGDMSAASAAVIQAVDSSKDEETRIFLIRALGRLGGVEAADKLKAFTQDLNSFICAEALKSLHHMGEAPQDLDALLQDKAPRVRLAAARLIARTGGSDFVDELAEFTLAHDGYHRRHGGVLLRRAGAQAANAYLLAVLGDESRKMEWQAVIEALEVINTPLQNKAVG